MQEAIIYGDKIHLQGLASWDASDATLDYLAKNLQSGMNCLETGAGQTTLVFAAMDTNHIVITPSKSEKDNILKLAAKRNISLARVDFKIGYSQDILPYLKMPPLDLVYIDGGHGFPIPQIDWFFTAKALKIGGKLIIDDIDLWTGEILVDFLKREAGWSLEKILRRRTAIFIKTAEFSASEWCHQPYVISKSRLPQLVRKGVNGLKMLLSLDIKRLIAKIAHERALSKITKSTISKT